MDKYIIGRNIQRFTQLLMTEADPAKRATLQRLLADEMVKQASPPKSIDE